MEEMALYGSQRGVESRLDHLRAEGMSALSPVFYYNVFYYMAGSVWFLRDVCCLNEWVSG